MQEAMAPEQKASGMTSLNDHLTNLPSEILHMIFDYLFCSHHLFEHYLQDVKDRETSQCDHDLDRLAAASKVLRAEINDWAIHFMTTHSDITKFHMPKTAKKDMSFNMLRGRKGVLTWARSHCVFCGKTCSRRAILMNSFRCCAGCDKIHWPDKITKTNARKEYYLQDCHILPYPDRESLSVRLLYVNNGLPKIRCGTYMTAGVFTTMFLRKDVVKVATALHGDLDAHLTKMKVAREARRKKIHDNREAKRAADEAQLAQMVGGSANPVHLESHDNEEDDSNVIVLD